MIQKGQSGGESQQKGRIKILLLIIHVTKIDLNSYFIIEKMEVQRN
jgi:hypothetical protein